MQTLLSLPGNLPHLLRDLCRFEVMPRRLDENPTHMTIPGSRNPAFSPAVSCRVFRGYQAEVGHECSGRIKSPQITDFRGDHHGTQCGHATQRLLRLDQRSQRAGRDQFLDVRHQPLNTLGRVVECLGGVAKNACLGFVFERLRANPHHVPLGPVRSARPFAAVTQQKLAQLMPGGCLGLLGRIACSFQITQADGANAGACFRCCEQLVDSMTVGNPLSIAS